MHWYKKSAAKNAKNDFIKDFFKLMNNAVFGKAIENVSKHRNVTFIAKSSELFVSNRNERNTDVRE